MYVLLVLMISAKFQVKKHAACISFSTVFSNTPVTNDNQCRTPMSDLTRFIKLKLHALMLSSVNREEMTALDALIAGSLDLPEASPRSCQLNVHPCDFHTSPAMGNLF